jgi:L-2-hydroxyglutarate oxidase LhgO
MSKEKPLTKNYNTTIFHPFLLNFNDITKKNTHAIIPELISSKNTNNTLDDFKIIEEPNAIHILNAPSPAATSCLSIGKTIAEMALTRL